MKHDITNGRGFHDLVLELHLIGWGRPADYASGQEGIHASLVVASRPALVLSP
jgi:hypothetical protein